MHNIKNKFINVIKDLDLKFISLIYFIGSIIIISNPSPLTNGRLFLTIYILITIAFLSCAYQHKKNTIERMIKNDIIKWVATGLTFSVCLWYAKNKLNFDYEIEPEFINYSAYGYAFAIAIPLFSFIYGVCVFVYIYLRRITVYQSFYASIIMHPLYLILEKPIKEYPANNFIFSITIIIFISIGIIKMLTMAKNKNGKSMLKVFKIIRKDFKRGILILNIWFKKNNFNY